MTASKKDARGTARPSDSHDEDALALLEALDPSHDSARPIHAEAEFELDIDVAFGSEDDGAEPSASEDFYDLSEAEQLSDDGDDELIILDPDDEVPVEVIEEVPISVVDEVPAGEEFELFEIVEESDAMVPSGPESMPPPLPPRARAQSAPTGDQQVLGRLDVGAQRRKAFKDLQRRKQELEGECMALEAQLNQALVRLEEQELQMGALRQELERRDPEADGERELLGDPGARAQIEALQRQLSMAGVDEQELVARDERISELESELERVMQESERHQEALNARIARLESQMAEVAVQAGGPEPDSGEESEAERLHQENESLRFRLQALEPALVMSRQKIEAYRDEVERLKGALQQAMSDIKEQKRARLVAEEAYRESHARSESVDEEFSRLGGDLDETRAELASASEAAVRFEAQALEAASQRDEAQRQLEEAHRALEEAQERVESMTAALAQAQGERAQALDLLEGAHAEQSQLEEQLREEYSGELETLHQQLGQLRVQLAESETEAAQRLEELDEARAEGEASTKALQQFQEELARVRAESEQLRAAFDESQELATGALAEAERLQGHYDAAETARQALEGEREALETQLTEARHARAEVLGRLEQLQEELLEADAIEATLVALQETHDSLLAQREGELAQLQEVLAQRDELQSAHDALVVGYEGLQAGYEAQTAQLAQLQVDHEALAAERDALREGLQAAEAEARAAAGRAEAGEEALAAIRREHAEKVAQLEEANDEIQRSLQSMLSEYEVLHAASVDEKLGAIAEMEDQIDELHAQNDQLKRQAEELNRQLGEFQHQNAELLESQEDDRIQRERFQVAFQDLQRQLAERPEPTEVEELRQRVSELEQHLATKAEQLSQSESLRAEYEDLAEAFEAIQREHFDRGKQLMASLADGERMRANLTRIAQELSAVREEADALARHNENIESERNQLGDSVQRLQEQLTALESPSQQDRVDLLQDQLEREAARSFQLAEELKRVRAENEGLRSLEQMPSRPSNDAPSAPSGSPDHFDGLGVFSDDMHFGMEEDSGGQAPPVLGVGGPFEEPEEFSLPGQEPLFDPSPEESGAVLRESVEVPQDFIPYEPSDDEFDQGFHSFDEGAPLLHDRSPPPPGAREVFDDGFESFDEVPHQALAFEESEPEERGEIFEETFESFDELDPIYDDGFGGEDGFEQADPMAALAARNLLDACPTADFGLARGVDHRAGFLLAMANGDTTIKDMIDLSGSVLNPDAAAELVLQLLDSGALQVH